MTGSPQSGGQTSAEQYVISTAQAIGLPIPDEYRQGVIENYGRILPLAQLVMDFPLPPEIEVAPTFQP